MLVPFLEDKMLSRSMRLTVVAAAVLVVLGAVTSPVANAANLAAPAGGGVVSPDAVNLGRHAKPGRAIVNLDTGGIALFH